MITVTTKIPTDIIATFNSKGDQPWVFFGRNDAKAEIPILWPPHANIWLIGKDYDAGRDWGQEEKGMTEDEMAGWHHRLDGREFAWTPGVGDGQGGLVCCDLWGRKELDMTERLNWTEPIPWLESHLHSLPLSFSSAWYLKRDDPDLRISQQCTAVLFERKT